ncbi:MAG: hypothetical protein JEZ00_19220 [Anaerolineaceae bacterium]|nr:hypothetical protein [Anaerolineaceae bacterium]
MIDIKKIDRFPDNNLQEGIKILDDLYWFVRTEYKGNIWYIYFGDILMFRTDSEEAFDAFLYGLGITYIIYPSEIINVLHEELKKWAE